MIRRTRVSRLLLGVACLSLTPTISWADDFGPPPWDRGDPRAITAEWEFLTPANPTGPDGPLTNVFAKGSGTAPGGTSAFIFGAGGLGWGPGDGDGGWFFPDGGHITFRVDNIVDTEPVKHLWLQVTHTPGLGVSVDPLFTFNIGATGSSPTAVSPIFHGPTSTIFYWDMFPNPPWEDFRLVVSGTGEIDQVLIDTISVPEPSTLVLCGAGLLLLGFGVRRRRKRA